MDTKQAAQDLKSERVQEELVAVPVRRGELFVDVADEPFWVSLKAERVQTPTLHAEEEPTQLTSTLQLTVSQKQPVTIETLGTVITLHGAPAAANVAGGGEDPSSAGQAETA